MIRRLSIFACLLIGVAAAPAWCADIAIGGGARADVPVRSLKDLRDGNVVKQQYDYSCGAASLATILRYGFGEDVSERDILDQLFAVLSADEVDVSRKRGFNLLDLQRVAQALGYSAQGYRLEPRYLIKLGGPVIIFIEPRGYQHFAVLRGIRDDRVFLADPSRGNIRMPVYRFIDTWLQDDRKGIIFVVEPEGGLPDGYMPLALSTEGLPQPEIMTARDMLAVGNPYVRLPELSR